MPDTIIIPHLRVPRVQTPMALDDAAAWSVLSTTGPLWLADGTGPALQSTFVRVCFDAEALYVRFECNDRDIWGTYTERDDPLYEQEAVEVFLAPGTADPVHYFEFEVSPNGVLFDTTVYNPTATRADLRWDASWNCPGIRWRAGRGDAAGTWWAALAIPWAGTMPDKHAPQVCRANFLRIEQPRDGAPEFSCWSPTFTDPADFHKPAYFGWLEFA